MATNGHTIAPSTTAARDAGAETLDLAVREVSSMPGRENGTASLNGTTLEHQELREELQRTRRQLENERRSNEPLKRQIHDLRLKLAEGEGPLRRQIATLTEKVNELSSRPENHAKEYLDGIRDASRPLSPGERIIMTQQIESWKTQAEKWKAEAMRQGSETIGLCWQASVDEAVRREREKDGFVIKALQDEIAALKEKAEEKDS